MVSASSALQPCQARPEPAAVFSQVTWPPCQCASRWGCQWLPVGVPYKGYWLPTAPLQDAVKATLAQQRLYLQLEAGSFLCAKKCSPALCQVPDLGSELSIPPVHPMIPMGKQPRLHHARCCRAGLGGQVCFSAAWTSVFSTGDGFTGVELQHEARSLCKAKRLLDWRQGWEVRVAPFGRPLSSWRSPPSNTKQDDPLESEVKSSSITFLLVPKTPGWMSRFGGGGEW